MPHQNTSSSDSTAQNAATDPVQASDTPSPTEARSYRAANAASSLAPRAAGEVADDMDEGDALAAGDVQQGSAHANRPARTESRSSQGPKTIRANREQLKS